MARLELTVGEKRLLAASAGLSAVCVLTAAWFLFEISRGLREAYRSFE